MKNALLRLLNWTTLPSIVLIVAWAVSTFLPDSFWLGSAIALTDP